MSDIAVVPLKNLAEAKKRLANHLDPDERKTLVLAMLDDVLDALSRSKLFSEIDVISPDKSIEGRVRRRRAVFIKQRGAGLNSAIRQAMRELKRRKAASVTTVLADLPLAEPSDFRQLVKISPERRRIVMAPSLKGGTNVMFRSPPNLIRTSYGRWSFAKHLRMSQKKNVPTYAISNSRLSFDVDTIHDLRALLKIDRAGRTRASRVARKFAVFADKE
jgi:2-phospho-L-lactate/phosphoenolpyruvate guanylyltransferase